MLKSKTLWFAVALSVLGTVQTMTDVFKPFMTDKLFGLFTLGVAVVVAVLRIVTTKPLNEK